MNKKTVLAFAFSFVILLLYPFYIKLITPPSSSNFRLPLEESVSFLETHQETLPNIGQKKTVESEIQNHTASKALPEQIYSLTNGDVEYVFSNYGARIIQISLEKYHLSNTSNERVVLFSRDKQQVDAIGDIRLFVDNVVNNRFTLSPFVVTHQSDFEITFQSDPINGFAVRKEYKIREASFVIDCAIYITNVSAAPAQVAIEFSAGINYLGDKLNKQFSGIVIKSYNDFITTKINKIKKGFSFDGHIDWIANEDKYFAVIAKPQFSALSARSIDVNDSIINSYIYSSDSTLNNGDTAKKEIFLYTGPKLDAVLSSYNEGFQNILYTGFLWWLNKLILILLSFFYGFFKNYGFAIIALTVLAKIVLTPLTHQSFQSMKKMQELQPQMKALQEKHKENPQQLNKEVMELYKKHKANPLGGCWPMLLQLPIFIALYKTLSQAVELRGAPFIFWIEDLSAPDKMFANPLGLPFDINLLPLLMIGSMVVQQKMTPSAASKEQEKMMLIMPLVFGLLFYNLPSGLVLYWFVSNILTIAHQYIMRKK